MNKKVIILTIFIILGMITFPTIYKIYDNHNKHLVEVVEKEFLYNAQECFNSNVCSNKIVSLKDLYDHNYLKTKLTNPLNKKYYQEDSYVNLETNEIKLIS